MKNLISLKKTFLKKVGSKLFLKRHPKLVHRTSEVVTGASSNVSETDVRKWFSGIQKYLTEKQYLSILNDPTRIYNGDVTSFLFCPKLGKIIVPGGSKNVYEIDQENAKKNLTVMFTFNSSEYTAPPLVIFPNKRLKPAVSNSIPGDWGIGLSENGWMTSQIFFDYIQNILHSNLVKINIQFPIILFIDGHKTHLRYETSMLCRGLNIVLIAIYPNSTRVLQPTDVACFKPLTMARRGEVLEWRR